MTYAGAGNRRSRGRFNVATLLVVLVGVPLAALALLFDAGRRRQQSRLQRVVEEISCAAVTHPGRRDERGKHAAA